MTDIDHKVPPPPPANARPSVTDYLLAMGQELRAPLNAVIGMSGLLLDSELTAQQRHYVRSVHSAGETLGTILNDVLDLARISNARLVVEPIPFDLKSMIEETASVLTPRANERGLALRVDLRPELPRHVIGDPGRTRQVLGNLIGHAVSATSQGEVVIRVQPDTEHGDQPWIKFVVEDTGIGISPSRLARVFDEYVPVDASPYRSFGVTGLGFRLSAELIRLMGGEIGAESLAGKGTKFWFALPMPVAAPTGAGAASETAGPRGGRALVVEADLSSRSRFAVQLEAAGWDVHFVEDIERVIPEMREGAAVGNPYHCCIFSHYAVRPAHADLACRLKADPALASVALVMVTAVGSPGEGKRLWHAGFAAYLRKPVPNEEVQETLAAIEQIGPTGRGTSLITRHSLAEARNAQTFATEGIDEMLASLTGEFDEPTAEATPIVLDPFVSAAPEPELASDPAPAIETAADAETAAEAISTEEPRLAWIASEPTPPVDAVAPEAESAAAAPPVPEPAAVPVWPVTPATAFFAPAPWPPRHPAPEPAPAEGTARDVEAWLASAPQPAESATTTAAPATDPEPAAADIDGYLDAQWETHPAVEAVAGFVATDDREALPDPDAEVESVLVGPPGADLDAVAADSEIADESLVAPIFDDTDSAEVEPVLLEGPGAFAEAAESGPLEALPEAEVDHEPLAAAATHLAEPEVAAPVVLPEAESAWTEPPAEIPAEAASEAIEIDAAVAEPEAAAEPVVLEPAEELTLTAPDADDQAAIPILELEPAHEEPATPAEPAAGFEAEVALGLEPTHLAAEDDGGGDHHAPLELMSTAPEAAVAAAPIAVAVEGLDPASPALLDQLAHGGGFFTQYQVVAFLREAPARIADIATASTRGDGARMGDALAQLQRIAESIGAARLAAWAEATAGAVARGELEAAATSLGSIEHAFLEARQALDLAGPSGLPSDPAPIGTSFVDQLSPAKEGPARLLAVKLATSFLGDAPKRFADLKGAVAQADGDAVQRVAQTLKGMCGLIGAEPLAKLVALTEADARLRRVAQADRYLGHIELELARVTEALERARG